MDPTVHRAVNDHLMRHHGIITRSEALHLGMTDSHLRHRLRSGAWRSVHRGVYTPSGAALSPEAAIRAACAAGGPRAVASHRSAAWLWGLLPQPPPITTISVPRSAGGRVRGVRVHHTALRRRPVRRDGIPVTGIAPTLLDLASVASEPEIDHAVDIALARRYIRVRQLQELVAPVGTVRRRGVIPLRRALARRGFIGAPTPSKLESMTARLLTSWGYTPLAVEQEVCGGLFRADFTLARKVLLEVDGYTYHSSPQAKAADSHRRNLLRAAGYTVIEADWMTVLHHPDRLRQEILAVVGPPARLPRRRGTSSGAGGSRSEASRPGAAGVEAAVAGFAGSGSAV